MKAGTIPCKHGEKWKTVDGTEDYFISNLGRFRHGKKLMKLSVDKDGYLTCNVGKKRMKVHRLVAMAFVPNPDSKPIVDHISGDKLDCTAGNLRWVTHSENTQAAYDLGLIKKNEMLPVLVLDADNNGKIYSNQTEAAKSLGVSYKNMNDAIRGIVKHIKGYKCFKLRSLVDMRKEKESSD